MTRQFIKGAFPLLLIVAVLTVMPSITRLVEGYGSLSGTLSDFMCAIVLGVILVKLQRSSRVLAAITWSMIQVSSFMLLNAMARLPSWSDVHFLTDPSFIGNSAGGFDGSQLVVLAIATLSVLAIAFVPAPRQLVEKRSNKPTKVSLMIFTTFLLVSGSTHKYLVSTSDESVNFYSYYNPLHWQIAEAYQYLTSSSAPLAAPTVMQHDLSGSSLIEGQGKATNVIIVAMEGMTGAYLKQAREEMGVTGDNPALLFPKLSALAKEGMVTPDFITHSHQTIRGLYSILCADMDKLSSGAPKTIELQNSPARSKQCLPSVLKDQGYSTHYLQGAGLAFMGKDRIMPLIGFEQTHGNEWFKNRHHLKFGWGVDDKTFFEGALNYVTNLRKDAKKNGGQPWMLTMLTVGTHQPYAVPDGMVEKYGNRKAASVAYLDEAVTSFMQSLKRQGVLKDTLVILTSDESHGAEIADWVSSWGINIVFAPEGKSLPPIKHGQYALSDTSLSVLDYLGIESKVTAGRSLFRDYSQAREMASNTAGRLRWLRNGERYECSVLGDCRVCPATSIIGFAACDENKAAPYSELTRKAAWLDESVLRQSTASTTLEFADGAVFHIKKGYQNEWMDNLIGAQYLDFPAKTRTTVTMRWKIMSAGAEGGALKLALKQSEQEVKDVSVDIPTLKSGEEKEYTFVFDNPDRRFNFSFHLLPSTPMDIDILRFTVKNEPI